MAPHTQFAIDFATALVEGDFDGAVSMLSPELRQQFTSDSLRESFFGMFRDYATGQPRAAELIDDEFSMEDWASKQPGDVGWTYVCIEGDDFNEAVAVVVCEIEGKLLIREIEWGEP